MGKVTPMLKGKYDELKAAGMEIVFVSWDKSQEQFDNYYEQMPWLALPFEHRDVQKALTSKFEVRGIPNLLLFDGDANMYNRDGVQSVLGLGMDVYPWKPLSFAECVADVTKKGQPVEGLENKTLGFYFSATWCPPCQRFTPKLIEWYNNNAERLNLEIIFVTSDKNEEAYNKYYKKMPWATIGYDNKRVSFSLGQKFGNEGIPFLGLVEYDGTFVTKEVSTSRLMADPNGEEFPYPELPINDLANGADGISGHPAIVLLHANASEAEQQQGIDSIAAMADEQLALGDKRTNVFFTENTKCEIGTTIRQLTKLTNSNKMIFLILNQGIFFVSDLPKASADVDSFLDRIKKGKEKPRQLQRG